MRRVLGVVASLAALAALCGAALLWSGVLSFAANDPHLPVTRWVIETARIRSIRVHAAGIAPPADLADPARVVAGTAHFSEHCATCHSAPGVEAQDMAEGMYPKPPALTDAARAWTPGELFWILRNGIKMSGMPSWADHGDPALWDIVAFLERMPGMSAQTYGQLVVASMKAGGHDMHGAGMRMERQGGVADQASPSGKQP